MTCRVASPLGGVTPIIPMIRIVMLDPFRLAHGVCAHENGSQGDDRRDAAEGTYAFSRLCCVTTHNGGVIAGLGRPKDGVASLAYARRSMSLSSSRQPYV